MRLTFALYAAALAIALPAHAAIVVQHGIAGLDLQMTKAQVRAKLGTQVTARVHNIRTGNGRVSSVSFGFVID